MEDRNVIKSLVQKDDFFISIDLKDAFHSIDLHPDSKRLTSFEFDGKRYSFNKLPFGLTSASRIFSQVLKPVIAHLRLSGLRITSYLDDILICASSYTQAISDMNKAIDLLTSLGFSINFEKSNLVPSKIIIHIGYSWNSMDMTLSLPDEKIRKIKSLSNKCLNKIVSIRTLASLLGLYVSSANGFKYAPLHYRQFQFDFISSINTKSSWDSTWTLSDKARSDIMWWATVDKSDLTPVHIIDFCPEVSLFSDASKIGWGAFLSSGEYISGSWTSKESQEHINYLELKAVYLALSKFSDILYDKSVLIRCDNTTSVFYINKMGGTHSKKLCLLALEIWHLMISHSMKCLSSHISGINNNIADFLSRHSHLHEYFISPNAFKALRLLLPFKLEIDLFASNENRKLPLYVSLFEDSHSLCNDAFSFSWPSHIYAFPPIPLIAKTVSEIEQDEVDSCLLITPAWSSLAFIPLLKQMLIFNPIFIHSMYLLGYLPTRHPFHLMAWPISASCAVRKEFPKIFPMPSSRVLVPQHLRIIPGSGQTLFNGLVAENLHPVCLQI